MKKTYYALMLAAGLPMFSMAQSSDPSPYCVASFQGGEYELPRAIVEVTLATMTNVTGETQSAAPHYVYYNNITAPELTKGQSYSLNVRTGADQTMHFVAAFIDFNGDNQFDVVTERVLGVSLQDENTSNPAVATFTVPASAASGTTRMRVIAFTDDEYTWEQNNTDYLACTAFNGGLLAYGETEDYNVSIVGGTTVGVEKLEIAPEFRMVPNPSNGILNITDAMKGGTLEILSVNGAQLLIEKDLNVDRLDVSNLPKGTVIVRLYTNDNVIVQKVTIN